MIVPLIYYGWKWTLWNANELLACPPNERRPVNVPIGA